MFSSLLFSNYIIMKKNLLFSLLAVFLAWFWFGGISMANNVAKIGEWECESESITCYETLGAAITAAQENDTVTLLEDVTENFSVNKSLTLNLWWKTLTVNANEWIQSTNGILTITNGNINWNWNDDIISAKWGTITLWDELTITNTSSIIYAYNGWDIIVNGANLSSSEGKKYSLAFVTWEWSSLTISNWDVSSSVNSVTVSAKNNWTVLIQWWTVTSSASNAIASQSNSTVTIKWWTVSTTAPHGENNYWMAAFTATKWQIIVEWWEINASDWYWLAATNDSSITIKWWTVNNWVVAHEWDTALITIQDDAIVNWPVRAWSTNATDPKSRGKIIVNWGKINWTVSTANENWKIEINWWTFSGLPTSVYTVPTNKYLAEQEDGTYQLDDQTAISEIKVNITAPVKDWAPITPTTDTEWITFTADGIKWYKTVDNSDTELSADEKYAENTAYKVVIPYTVADSHYLADTYTVTPTAWNENHTTEWQITISFEANAVAEWYTIKFVNHDWTELKTYTVTAGETPAYDWAIPTKASDSSYTYSFKWWSPDIVGATDNATYTAEFTANSKPSYSWGGGSLRGSSTTTTKKDDTKKAEETTKDETKVDETKANEENKAEEKAPMTDDEAVAKYWQEQIDAYKWALENGITTMKTVEDARLGDTLTRAELAKMMVVYIAKVLWKQPVVTGSAIYDDVDNSLGDLAGYIQLAYQYQIMWIDAKGNSIQSFNPNGKVTRWEYATVFSRVLFGSLFNKEWADFYTNHLKALEAAGILSNTEPTIQEVRGWVLLMMYRSSKNTDKIAEVAAVVEASQQEVAEAESKAEETPAEGTWAMIWMPNPAAVYCEEQWWTINIVKDAEWNESGMCKLADGTEVEEWEYYRANHTEATTWDVAEAPETEATTWDVASN